MIRPTHYKTENPKYEVWQVVIDYQLSFFGGNVLKYIARAGKKGSEKEDIEKAITYLQKADSDNVPLSKENNFLYNSDLIPIANSFGIEYKTFLYYALACIFSNHTKQAIKELQSHLNTLTNATT